MSIEDKLAQVAQRMADGVQVGAKKDKPFVCPIDPAERALCEACQ